MIEQLLEPFPSDDIEWRIQRSGITRDNPWAMVLAYITARAVMDRLDSVVGVGGWYDDYVTGPDGGLLCRLSVRVDGEFITKCDGAENTKVEAIKGGFSGALKRAAVKYGVGRYLYNLTDNFANFHAAGKNKVKIENSWYKWDPPALPHWALPASNIQKLTRLIGLSENFAEFQVLKKKAREMAGDFPTASKDRRTLVAAVKEKEQSFVTG